jgi:predicted DNA-binding transcriptional regulator AlpA
MELKRAMSKLQQNLLDLQMFREALLNNQKSNTIGYKLNKVGYCEMADKGSAKIFHNRIWRVKDVAEFLGCSIGHIYNLSSDEKIPKVKKGKFLVFIPEQIFEWVIQGDVL